MPEGTRSGYQAVRMECTVDDDTFDLFVAGLDYPMHIVTVPGPAGCLVGFATQCSIGPPRFLVCLSKQNHTYRAAREADTVAVHSLTRAERDLAALFGTRTGDEVDKFDQCRWHLGHGGVPILERAAAWFVGRIVDRVDLGDHEGLVLEPSDVGGRTPTRPLMFSAVRNLEAGHPA
jgi:flavin reductase (DIM6/NTAB) family NADH-FMN oxidoreductase RutF